MRILSALLTGLLNIFYSRLNVFSVGFICTFNWFVLEVFGLFLVVNMRPALNTLPVLSPLQSPDLKSMEER